MAKKVTYLIWSKGNNDHCPLIRSDLPDNSHLIELGAVVITEVEFWEIAQGHPDYVDFLSRASPLPRPEKKPPAQPHQPALF